MGYPMILNGDHAEFEIEHANTPPKERPDWPMPSFDAMDWAEAFCSTARKLVREGSDPVELLEDEAWMVSWFANALMRGFDEHASRVNFRETTKVRWGFKSKTQLPLFMVWREYRVAGEVQYATVMFNSTNWVGF